MKNSRIILCLMLLYLSISVSAQDRKPDWVEKRPSSMLDYIGIASASKNCVDYTEVAKRSAMAELISQIEVNVSVNSLVTITEQDDNDISSYFSETVKTSATKRLSNLQLYDTWEDEDNYWVFYRLDKDEYVEQLKKNIALVTKKGSDLWQSGAQSLQNGDLMTALEYFMNGLSVIEPYANEDLRYEYDKNYSLGNILYNSFRTIFDGIEIQSFPTSIEVETFKGKPMTISLMLTRENKPLRNMKIKGEFVNGLGSISPIAPTDAYGKTTFDLQNVTSKNANQSLRLQLDTRNFIKNNDESYVKMLKYLNKNLPSCVINLTTSDNSTISAYIESDDSNNDAVVKSLKTFINNKYFDITDCPNIADLILKVDAKFDKGGLVKGDVYNMNEYFVTINISFVDNRTSRELSNYSLSTKRTLVPVNVSGRSAINAAIRDAMKTVKRQLPDYLKNLKINRNAPIPQRNYPEEKEPVIVEPEPEPIVEPEPEPIVEPEPESIVEPEPAPAPQPKPAPENIIEDELEEDIFVRYVGKKDYSGKSIFKFVIINKRNDDYQLHIYKSNLKAIDNNGNEKEISNMRLGSRSDSNSVKQLVVPDIPTSFEIEVPKVEALALFSLKIFSTINDKEAKLRKLNY